MKKALVFTLLLASYLLAGPVWQKISGTTSGGTGGGTQPSAGLISYHAFELNAVDTKDASYNGTASNVSFNDGKSGNGRCFTTGGNGSSYVSIPNTLLRGRSNVTISMWVYIQSGQGTLPIIGWQYPGGDMPPLGVFYTGSGGHADNGDGSGAMPYNSFHINLGNSGGQEIVNFTYAQPPAGWHFFTMSTNSSGTLKLYMDGGNIGVWSAPTWRYFSTNYTYPIYLGMHPYTPAPIYTQTSIDEMRVYNYEMTGAEVLSLYQSYIQ